MKLSPSLIAFHNISQENERRCSQTISRQKNMFILRKITIYREVSVIACRLRLNDHQILNSSVWWDAAAISSLAQ